MIDIAIQHCRRAQAFLADFDSASSAEDKERFLASAVENSVAIVQCFRGHVADARLQELAWSIPRFRLLKRVRIHNFHRRPVPFLSAGIRSKARFYAMQGPIALQVGPEPNSQASLTLTENGPVYGEGNGGKVVRHPGGAAGTENEIVIIDGKVWDEFGESCVALDDAVRQFLNRVPRFLDKIQQTT
jgi:hypothetical protein